MTRFLSFAGALLLMLACALTAHAQTTTNITISGNVVKHDTTHLVGTYNVVAKVYQVSNDSLVWTSSLISGVVFGSPNGAFNLTVSAVPNAYFTAPPSLPNYEVELVVNPDTPIVLSPRIGLTNATSYSNDTFTW